MSTSTPIIAPKRSHSASPPPPSVPSATSPQLVAKRVKLDLDLPTPEALPPAVAEVVAPALVVTPVVAGKQKQKQNNKEKKGRRKGGKGKAPKPGGAEETGYFDTVELLGLERVKEMEGLAEEGREWRKEAEEEWGIGQEGKDVEVRVLGMSAHGDGLALLTPSGSDAPTRLLTIPFTLPNELVSVHVHRHEPDFFMSHGDLLRIIEPSPQRTLAEGEVVQDVAVVSEELKATREKFGDRVQCKYFGVCSGCQYQPISYEDQLTLKQSVVRKAFANFSSLDPSLIPAIGPTLPSPLQYAYRTKLTPHFQAPPASGKSGGRKAQWKGKGKGRVQVDEGEEKEWEITIGFEQKGRKRIIDIEECVIATKVINDAMTIEREKVKTNISDYKRGATLLLRDSLPPRAEGATKPISSEVLASSEPHVCITDHHATVREQIGTVEFEQMAGSFFQNNNSILPSLLSYIANSVRPVDAPARDLNVKSYLVDAYCGSGLFAITLADQFDRIEGVEIDKASVKWAKLNAEYNKGEGRGEVDFRAGNAEAIFDTIEFPPAQTTIVIDPPRKGCDSLFLSQLLAFNPATIIYVSCNVHTQARDIGWIVKESANKVAEAGGEQKGFWIESIRAADLFANTHHAEGVAVLRREV